MWLPYLASFGRLAEDSPPATSAPADLLAPFLGYGLCGVLVIVLAWVLWKGSFVRSDEAKARIAAAAADADKRVAEARADLLAENERLRAERDKADRQREELLRFLQEQLMPMMANFTSATTSLLPVLQALTARGGGSLPAPYRFRGPDDV